VDERMMRLALRHAALAGERGEVPVGCVVARGGEVLAPGGAQRDDLGVGGGVAGSVMDVLGHAGLPSRVALVQGGLLADESREILRAFFAGRR
jgi:tRNA(Arg) A34 adenosine deaminase TadA